MTAKIAVTGSNAVLRPDRGALNHVYQVTNSGEDTVPVEVTVFRSKYTLDGEEELVTDDEIEDNFMIFPPQMVIPPGETRGLKLSYLGDPPAEEVAYRVVIEEVPDIELSEEGLQEHEKYMKTKQVGMSVTFLYKYVTRLWVKPDGVSPDLKTVSFEKVVKDDQDSLRILVKNDGKGYESFEYPKVDLILKSGKEISGGDAKEIRESVGNQTILPGAQRAFYIPWQADWPSVDSIKTVKIEEGTKPVSEAESVAEAKES